MKELCPGLLATILDVPWHKFLGVQVEETRRGYTRLRLPYKPEFAGNVHRGALHGGVLAALADICAITTLWTFCTQADRSSTVDLKVDYLRPAPLQDLVAEGEIRMLGNHLGNVAVYIRPDDAPEWTVAEARAVCYRIRGGSMDAAACAASTEIVSG